MIVTLCKAKCSLYVLAWRFYVLFYDLYVKYSSEIDKNLPIFLAKFS